MYVFYLPFFVAEYVFHNSSNHDYDDTKEIRPMLCIARSAMASLTNVLKDKGIAIIRKKRLLSTLVFSISSHAQNVE